MKLKKEMLGVEEEERKWGEGGKKEQGRAENY